MKEGILLTIAGIFAVIYNTIVLMVNLASADGELEITSAVLTVLNTIKDAMVIAAILFSIFLG